MNGDSSVRLPKTGGGRWLLLLLLLGGTLAVVCHEGFRPYEVLWANDTALGAMSASAARLPGTFTGFWGDFWWIGGATPSSSPSLSTLLAAVVSPAIYLKVYAPLTMLFFGFCTWFFFRQLRFSALASVIAGLAAGLNMHFFSNGCWGLGTWTVSCGMVFVALGILVSPRIRSLWIKGVLTGLSVGMVVMEGFDVGAILSVYIGFFLAFLFLSTEAKVVTGIARTVGVGALVVFFALFISASALYTLVGTQINGTQTAESSRNQDNLKNWNFAVQWSIPKLETLRVIVPGIFGYRLADYTTSTNKAGIYWGKVGEDPVIGELESSDPKTRSAAAALLNMPPDIRRVMESGEVKTREMIIDQVKTSGITLRHTGNGEYAGVLVCLLALFGLASAARKAGSPFSTGERRLVWFWGGAAVFSLFAAWGQHGFVYRLIYHLPLFANIRSPMKFMHPLNISLIILCGFGLEALHRHYLQRPANGAGDLFRNRLVWWKVAPAFEKFWATGMAAVLVFAVAGYFILRASKAALISRLQHDGFDSIVSPQMAGFCIGEVALFILFLALSSAAILSILTVTWAGKKAVWAWVFLSAIMICDLSRADLPWVRYYNYQEKYSANPVVDVLRNKPWEHRVVSRFSPVQTSYDIAPDINWARLCHWWLENDYPYNDIQSLEIDQAPRLPVLDGNYIGSCTPRSENDLSPAALQWISTHARENNPFWNWVVQSGPAARLWRLTNTRYIYADARLTDVLNQFAEPPNSFRTMMRTDMVGKPGVQRVEDFGDVTVQTDAQGPMALIEFTGALPRTKLYAHWQMLDDPATLQTLTSREFDPNKTVLVSQDTPVPQQPGSTESDAGTAEITQYQAKDLLVQTNAKTSAILLLNDRTGDNWTVSVDHKPAQLLRCNYIMRGVLVPPGIHTIEFRFQPPLRFLYVSIAAVALGILLASQVIYARFWGEPDPPFRKPDRWDGPTPSPA
jgi:hypothetical protein